MLTIFRKANGCFYNVKFNRKRFYSNVVFRQLSTNTQGFMRCFEHDFLKLDALLSKEKPDQTFKGDKVGT